jgi:hypothetical protein
MQLSRVFITYLLFDTTCAAQQLLRVCRRVADLDLPNTDGEKGQWPREKTKPYSCLHDLFRLEVLPSFWQQGIVSNTRTRIPGISLGAASCEPLLVVVLVGTLQIAGLRTYVVVLYLSSMKRKEDEPTVRTGMSDEGKTILSNAFQNVISIGGTSSTFLCLLSHTHRSNLMMGLELAPLVAWPILTMAAAVTSWRDDGCSPVDSNDSYRRTTATRTRRSRSSRRSYLDIEQELLTPPIPRVISFPSPRSSTTTNEAHFTSNEDDVAVVSLVRDFRTKLV